MGIHELSSEVVDQIAAGEVVERPAHLVKELVENSIDAGATEVIVDFDHGGKFVKVTDNGAGIAKDELLLALNRHATSKISTADDLWTLSSFGFRGEALASISAVSSLTMTSRQSNSDLAYQVKSVFGKKQGPEEVGGAVGTTVIIEKLFENIPARLKFLKSDTAESTQIKNVVKAMAMAHPSVSIKIKQANKLLYFWEKQQDFVNRAEQVLGVEELYFGEAELLGMKARVAVSAPNNTMRSSRQIWIYVQNRWVQDRSLQAAVMDAYRNLLMHGEYPYVVVQLSVPPEQIDVNIHPAKSQIKFENPSNAFRVVLRAVRGVLEKAPWIQKLLADGVEPPVISSKPMHLTSPETPQQTMSFAAPEFKTAQYQQKTMVIDEPKVTLQALLEAKDATSEYPQQQSVDTENTDTSRGEPGWSGLQVLGQANLTYIITQSARAMVMVDQHAAHERVLFEKLMQGWKSGSIEIQNYLLPLTVDLEAEVVEGIVKHQPQLLSLGISIDQSGPETVAVRAAPTVLKEKSIVKVLEILGREILEKSGSFALEKCIGDVCATMACHSAIRAGQALSVEEMQALLVQMDEFPLSSFCPHGRPVYVNYNFNKLEKDFGRIV